MSRRRSHARIAVLVFTPFAVAVFACQAPYRPFPYVPKDGLAPAPLICHDGIGHIRGNKPWILGGNCCCIPREDNYALHVSHGTIAASVGYAQYLQKYQARGIVTDLDPEGCIGLHVTLGGKCMTTPIVGTMMYEYITFGPHSAGGLLSANR